MNNCPTCIFQENGECHFNPPIAWDDMSFPRRGMYTKVSNLDWCGQYQSKPDVIETLPETVNYMGIPELPKQRGRPKGS